ncbi:hypothetical protein AVEN_251645-1 [Araneus ventricosus]|uniref:Uncharacterized protein n=1 Tax=Araneus ventricosus TaxID=182803 RepID=A0A4Y2FTN7_ARAVE|nr:hypothetical protein AVEN_251645-1 [Araneus ventricosus]
MSLLDESRWKKDTSLMIGEMPRTCGHRCAIGNNALRGACGHRYLRCIGKIGGKSEFPMLRKNDNTNGDDCVTSIFSDASKIGTALLQTKEIYLFFPACQWGYFFIINAMMETPPTQYPKQDQVDTC